MHMNKVPTINHIITYILVGHIESKIIILWNFSDVLGCIIIVNIVRRHGKQIKQIDTISSDISRSQKCHRPKLLKIIIIKELQNH